MKVAGRTIHDYLSMTVEESIEAFKNIELTPEEREVVGEPLSEVLSRLQCLDDVGLGYLTLSRAMNTLSAAASERVSL